MVNREELYIGIFGKRNKGKSSLMNLLTGQQTSIVSDTPGTTTDPVKKSCEVFGMGKCVFVDTAGFDDTDNDTGRLRSGKTLDWLTRMDLGILVISDNTLSQEDKNFAALMSRSGIPFVLVHNKSDVKKMSDGFRSMIESTYPASPLVDFSAKTAQNADAVVAALDKLFRENGPAPEPVPCLKDIIKQGDIVVMVCPIDAEAPKDRLILPQVMFSRQCLDLFAVPVLCQLHELPSVLQNLKTAPALVITDSQVFGEVNGMVPENIPLTSFSICLARQKGNNFFTYLEGTEKLALLEDGQKILVLESCTHQINCHDIARGKLPILLQQKTGKKLEFEYTAGLDPLPENLNRYAAAIQCGGCMVTSRQLEQRIRRLTMENIPVSNYGMALAWCNGIFPRAVQIFK